MHGGARTGAPQAHAVNLRRQGVDQSHEVRGPSASPRGLLVPIADSVGSEVSASRPGSGAAAIRRPPANRHDRAGPPRRAARRPGARAAGRPRRPSLRSTGRGRPCGSPRRASAGRARDRPTPATPAGPAARPRRPRRPAAASGPSGGPPGSPSRPRPAAPAPRAPPPRARPGRRSARPRPAAAERRAPWAIPGRSRTRGASGRRDAPRSPRGRTRPGRRGDGRAAERVPAMPGATDVGPPGLRSVSEWVRRVSSAGACGGGAGGRKVVRP